jgi:hypothetical protein
VLPEMIRLAAAAFLETFPNTTMTAGYVPGSGWVPPAAVHRAVTFITEHAAQPVTVDQIAAAAGVPGRALREAFARYFETPPLGFLRRARLERQPRPGPRGRRDRHPPDPAARPGVHR